MALIAVHDIILMPLFLNIITISFSHAQKGTGKQVSGACEAAVVFIAKRGDLKVREAVKYSTCSILKKEVQRE